MSEKVVVTFIQETVKAEDGGYIPCFAVKGETGFYRSDWNWGADKEIAQKLCDERNEVMGLTKKEAMLIQISTMRN